MSPGRHSLPFFQGLASQTSGQESSVDAGSKARRSMQHELCERATPSKGFFLKVHTGREKGQKMV